MCGTPKKRRKMDEQNPTNLKLDVPMDEEAPKVSPKVSPKASPKVLPDELPTDQSSSSAVQLRETKIPPKGLPNLGNTCFFNSMSQCLLNTHHFQLYAQHVGKEFSFTVPDCNVVVYEKTFHLQAAGIKVVFDEPTPFIQVFKQFINEFYSNRSMNPRPVFNEVAKRAPRFRGWHQQDSHELLRYLIDGLRQEEEDAIGSAVMRHLETQEMDKKTSQLVKRAYMNFAKPFMDRVFCGVLLQIVRCSDCGHDSVCFEPFLDLSLPIPKDVTVNNASKQPQLSKSQKKKLAKKGKKKKNNKKERWSKQNSTEVKSDEQAATGNEENDVPSIGGEQDEASTCNGISKSNENDTDVDEEETGNLSDATPEPDRRESIAKLEFAHPLSNAEVKGGKSIQSALKRFTELEDLKGSNAYACEKCCAPVNKKLNKPYKMVGAQKKYLLYTLPPVLTLHLKRFEKNQQHSRVYTTKLNDHVEFPLILDVAPFCTKMTESVNKGQTKVLYSLYGVVCHSGSLSGGHYIAYVKSRKPIEFVEKFFREASRFDASAVGDFKRYADLQSTEAAKSKINDNVTEEEALAALDSSGVWYCCSDSSVQLSNQERVLNAQAYICCYERLY